MLSSTDSSLAPKLPGSVLDPPGTPTAASTTTVWTLPAASARRLGSPSSRSALLLALLLPVGIDPERIHALKACVSLPLYGCDRTHLSKQNTSEMSASAVVSDGIVPIWIASFEQLSRNTYPDCLWFYVNPIPLETNSHRPQRWIRKGGSKEHALV